jgi:hypothetical protein
MQWPALTPTKSSHHHPMGNCCSNAGPHAELEERKTPSHPQTPPMAPVESQVVEVLSRPRSRQSSIKHARESPQPGGASSYERSRAKSAPQKPPPRDVDDPPPLPSHRPRVKSSVASSSSPSSDHDQPSAGEGDHGWICVVSLTIIRALKANP